MALGARGSSANGASTTHAAVANDNKSYIYLLAAAARTKGDVVKIGVGNFGPVDAALADDTTVYRIAVADQNIASGTVGRYQVTGRATITTPSITTILGHGVDVFDGAIRDSTAAAEKPNGVTTQNDFGVVLTAATSSTTQDVWLYGDPITGQT